MAKENQYRTGTNTEDKEQGKGAANLPQKSNYKSTTKSIFGINKANVSGAIPTLADVIPGYRATQDAIETAYRVYQSGLKLSLSEIGFWKQLFVYGGTAKSPGLKGKDSLSKLLPGVGTTNEKNNYATHLKTLDRQDVANEFVFKTGDYFLPLSITYSVEAGKNAATSKLVDGVEIVQMINKRPKVISLHIRIERDPVRLKNETMANNMAIVSSQPKRYNSVLASSSSPTMEEDMAPVYQIVELGTYLGKLYENADVFAVENKTINNDLLVQWVFMESYTFTVNPGSTVVDIDMKLREINMDENAIVFTDQSTVNSSSSAGGGSAGGGSSSIFAR